MGSGAKLREKYEDKAICQIRSWLFPGISRSIFEGIKDKGKRKIWLNEGQTLGEAPLATCQFASEPEAQTPHTG